MQPLPKILQTHTLTERGIAVMWKLIQCALCFILCPLLVAQQAAQSSVPSAGPQTPQSDPATADLRPEQHETIAIPGDTKIELALREQAAPVTATYGSTIQLVVARDVVVNGVTAIHEGTAVAGIFTDERHGAHKLPRDERVSIRARELESGKPILINPSGRFLAERKPKPGLRYVPGWNPHSKTDLVITLVAVALTGLFVATYHE